MKNKLLYISNFILLIIITSCSSPKFYNEVAIMQKQIQNELIKKSNASKEIRIKDYNMNKLVFNKLKEELKNTQHIIYFYSPDSSISSKKIWFTVYDLDNKIFYNLENSTNNIKKIELVEKTDYLKDKYTLFVFDNYINNNCEILKKRGNEKLSGIRNYEAIYQVDLKNSKNKSCYFKNFIIMD